MRPEFKKPENLPDDIATSIVRASKRKTVWVTVDGDAFWLEREEKARALAAKHGGTVYPPETTRHA